MHEPRAGKGPGNGTPAEGVAAEGARFRRPDRPAGTPSEPRLRGGEADPFAEPIPGEAGGPYGATAANAANGANGANGAHGAEPSEDGAGGALVPGGARALAEPLAALAAAFQANAEALRRSQEVQADLHRALERADRSEMVVQTTGALNETFKGLTTVQRALVQRVTESEKEARTGRLFLPLLVLASIAVIGGVLWLVLQYVEHWRDQTVGTSDVATQLAGQFQRGVEQGRADEAGAQKSRAASQEERIRALEQSLAAAQSERDAKSAAAVAAAGELSALRAEVQTSRVDALKVRALEEEADRLRREASAKDPELDRLRRELAEERKDNAALRRQLGDAALLRTVGKEAAASPEPSMGEPSPAPDAPPADDPSVNSDRRTVDRVRGRMNDLLKLGAGTRPDYLQVLSVGGVTPNRVVDVKVGRYNASGRLLNSIVARDLRVTVDHLRRVVEMHFVEGHLERGGTQTPFAGGTYSTVVAEADQVSSWAASGFTFVSAK
jgi:hypothetical protein